MEARTVSHRYNGAAALNTTASDKIAQNGDRKTVHLQSTTEEEMGIVLPTQSCLEVVTPDTKTDEQLNQQ